MYGIAEVIAAHNLLRYVKGNTDEERLRMAAGATMAGLGYVFGPDLQARLQQHGATHPGAAHIAEGFHDRIMYAAGGAALGAVMGKHFGPKLHTTELVPKEIDDALVRAADEARDDPMRPGGLITVLSAGWLGYSLFLDGKTQEEQQRHLWGLGSGVVGYLYAPEMLRKIGSMQLPADAGDDAIELYARGGALIGTIAGGALGWTKGPEIITRLRATDNKAVERAP
jgi:hypothetical protein